MNISIQLHTVRDLMKDDFAGTMKKIADAGYKYVEGGLFGAHAKERKKVLDDLGLKVSAAWGQPNAENILQVAEEAALLGVKQLCGCWGASNFANEDEIKKTADFFQQAALLLAPHGLQMCYHNHWWEFDRPLADGRFGWDLFMDLAPAVQAQIDLYWASNFGRVDVPALVKRYAQRTPVVHIKDGPLGSREQPHTAVGAGKMPLKACVAALDPNVTKFLVVELDSCATDVMEAVRQSYRWIVDNGLGR